MKFYACKFDRVDCRILFFSILLGRIEEYSTLKFRFFEKLFSSKLSKMWIIEKLSFFYFDSKLVQKQNFWDWSADWFD